MKRLFFSLAILIAVNCFSYETYIFYPQGSFLFSISGYGGSGWLTGFRFTDAIIYGVEGNKQASIGKVEKLNEWTRAYEYKVADQVLSTHHASLLSYGAIFDRLKEYEVRDEENNLIGRIEGIYSTEGAAEFFFFDDHQKVFAKAILSKSRSELIICNPAGQPLLNCKKTMHANYYNFYGQENEYFWTIKKENQASFNALFFWPFLAFISDVWPMNSSN